jgi:hypothetical protein
MIKKKYSIILAIIGLLFTITVLAIPFISKYLVDEAINIAKYDTNYEETVDLHRFWFVDHDGFICPRWGDAGDFRLLRERW